MSKVEAKLKILKDKLSELDKEELVTLLLHFTEIEEVKQELTVRFTGANKKENLAAFKKIIRSSIKKNADRHGFVAYRQVAEAAGGAWKVMEKAEETADQGQYLYAAQIAFCIMNEMYGLLQYCDDSDGIVGGLITDCLDLVYRLADEASNQEAQDGPELLQLILTEALHPELEGWSDWQLSLLQSALLLTVTPKQREQWEKMLDAVQAMNSDSSYYTEEIAELRYQVIRKFDGEKEAGRYLEQHLDFTVFREMAIKQEMDSFNYDKAMRLALDGEELDRKKGFPGLVHKWQEYRYAIYKGTGQREQQLVLAERFVADGEYEFYLEMKEHCTREEWLIVYPRILDALAQGASWKSEGLYVRILVEEKETLRLLHYVQKHARRIIDLYPHLVGPYPEEVYSLFTALITEEAADASNRGQYKKVCGIIKHLIRAGGITPAKAIIEHLLLAYPKRAALRDELRSIKL